MEEEKISRRSFVRNGSLVVLGSLAGGVLVASAEPKKSAQIEKPQKIKAALWIGGFSHEFETIAGEMVKFLLKKLPIELKVVRDGDFLDCPGSVGRDLIIMNHCYKSSEGVLTEKQKQKLLEAVNSGVGVVAIHASYYSFPEWDAVHDAFFGARFIKHGEVDIMIDVRITEKNHPITKDSAGSFQTHSELYQSTALDKTCHVLAMAKEKESGECPSVWIKTYGKGRIVTILPAHWPDAYEKREFQKLIANSCLWAKRKR